MRNSFLLLILIMVLSQLAFADDMQSIMNQTLAQSETLKNDSVSHIKNFDPTSSFSGYSANPNQTQYYGGVLQTDTSKLTQDARASSDVGSSITTSINSHPTYVVNQSDPDISHSQFIQSDADHIVQGVTDHYIDCNATQVCKTTYQNKTCEEAPQSILQFCKKTLNIDIIPHQVTTHYTLPIRLSTSDHDYAGVSVNTVSGHNNFIGPHDTTFWLDGRLPSNLDCKTIVSSITAINSKNSSTHLDYIHFPNCDNGMTLDFRFSGSGNINLTMQIDVASTVITYDLKDRWVENCDSLLTMPSCTFTSKTCDQPKETRTVNGVPLTRDCWEETYNYACHAGSGTGNCAPLQTAGCEQIDSQCEQNNNSQCTLYQQTYQCPVQSCSTSSNIACGDGKNYCLDGSCVDHSYTQSQDFAKGISALSAIADASKQFDPHSMTIFAGHSAECSEAPVGFSNCCTLTGWGSDVGLANCPQQANDLYHSRAAGVTTFVGKYCSGPDPFPCLVHSDVFCVFNSKLARIVQEQGRQGQLGIDFGNGDHPNCIGLTPDQLKSIDLNKIDFHDFYSDINAKQPDMNHVQQTIQQHIQQFQQAGQLND